MAAGGGGATIRNTTISCPTSLTLTAGTQLQITTQKRLVLITTGALGHHGHTQHS